MWGVAGGLWFLLDLGQQHSGMTDNVVISVACSFPSFTKFFGRKSSTYLVAKPLFWIPATSGDDATPGMTEGGNFWVGKAGHLGRFRLSRHTCGLPRFVIPADC